MATKFYKCRHCGNVVVKFYDSKVPVVCCGEQMQDLSPNSVDASSEKHVPVINKPEAIVCVGSARPVAVYEYCNIHGLWMKEL